MSTEDLVNKCMDAVRGRLPPNIQYVALELVEAHIVLAAFDDEIELFWSSSTQPDASKRAVVLRLGSMRNAYCPVNCLPTETLQNIFLYLPAVLQHCTGFYATNLLRASWTCSHWRTLALRDPRLWTGIDCAFMELASLFLQRSGSCLLEVKCRYNGTSSFARLAALRLSARREALFKPHLANIKILEYQPPREVLPPWMQEWPAPNLEELVIRSGSELCTHPTGQLLPPSLFGNSMPRLRRLDLGIFRLPVTPGMYRGLTQLIINAMASSSVLDSHEDLLHIFRECPDLEHLHISLRWFQQSSVQVPIVLPTTPRRIPMHSLRYFSVCLPKPHVHRILDVIDLPTRHMTKFHIFQTIRPEGSCSSIFEYPYRYRNHLENLLAASEDLTVYIKHEQLGFKARGTNVDGQALIVDIHGWQSLDYIRDLERVQLALSDYQLPSVVYIDLEIWSDKQDERHINIVPLVSKTYSSLTTLSLTGSMFASAIDHLLRSPDSGAALATLTNLRAFSLTGHHSTNAKDEAHFFSLLPAQLTRIKLARCTLYINHTEPSGLGSIDWDNELLTLLCEQFRDTLEVLYVDHSVIHAMIQYHAHELVRAICNYSLSSITFLGTTFSIGEKNFELSAQEILDSHRTHHG